MQPICRRKPNFAEKLHALLTKADRYHDTISWMPSGRSFVIANQEKFVKEVLPKYLKEAKFESFSRRLKRWGFRKVYTNGMGQEIFSHDSFHRDRPDLCKDMNGRWKGKNQECTPRDTTSPVTSNTDAPVQSQGTAYDFKTIQQAQVEQQLQLQQVALQEQKIQQLRAFLSTSDFQNTSFNSSYMINGTGTQGMTTPPTPPFKTPTLNRTSCHDLWELNRLQEDIACGKEELALLRRLSQWRDLQGMGLQNIQSRCSVMYCPSPPVSGGCTPSLVESMHPTLEAPKRDGTTIQHAPSLASLQDEIASSEMRLMMLKRLNTLKEHEVMGTSRLQGMSSLST
jgi:hypothetical protein